MTTTMKRPVKRLGFNRKPYIEMFSHSTGENVRYIFNTNAPVSNRVDSLEMVDGGVRVKLHAHDNGTFRMHADMFYPDSVLAPNPEAFLYEVEPQFSMGIYTREDAWYESEDYKRSITPDPY